MRTEKFRLQRSLLSLRDQMRQMRHQSIQQQVDDLNVVLRGHYAYYGIAGAYYGIAGAYYGIAGNIRALQRVYRAVERYWCKMLRSRSWAARAGMSRSVLK
jgi:RNA-directed DNA polymerase